MTPVQINDGSELDAFLSTATGKPASAKPRKGEIIHSPDRSFEIVGYPVTAKALEKHFKRFGPEGVEEIAMQAGVGLSKDITRKLPQRRRTTVGLKQQVKDLKARGVIPAGIGNVLNISERRVKAILRELAQVWDEPK
jgi:hypothetical protein